MRQKLAGMICLAAGVALMCAPVYADGFAGGSGTAEDPYQIAAAEELDAIRDEPGASYVLTEDIDLSGFGEWEPIGTFVPYGEPPEGEEMSETPDPEQAFSGTLDGGGHTISGLTINAPGGMAQGLFGCTSGAEIRDLRVENAQITAALMTGGVVGYAYDSVLQDVTAASSAVTADGAGAEEYGVNMLAGIAGAAMDTTFSGCAAEDVSIIAPDASANIGLVGGGLEDCSMNTCTASGVIVAGNDCYGLGGVFGCGFGADEIADCAADVTITAGSSAYLSGGIVGYAGSFDEEAATVISGCEANVVMALGGGASRIGGIIGGGFYLEEYKDSMPQPTFYVVRDCKANGSIMADGGTDIGIYMGNAYMGTGTGLSGDLTVIPVPEAEAVDAVSDVQNVEAAVDAASVEAAA